MNVHSLAVWAALAGLLSASIGGETPQPVRAESLLFPSNHAIFLAQNSQTSTLSLSARDLNQPHILSINVPPNVTSLRGDIILDGQAIAPLNPAGTSLNLAPYLLPGIHYLKIVGTYQPTDASVTVRFNGPQTQVSQSSAGSGTLNLNLVLEVNTP